MLDILNLLQVILAFIQLFKHHYKNNNIINDLDTPVC